MLGLGFPQPYKKQEALESEGDISKFIAANQVVCLNEKQSGSAQKACVTTTRLQSDCDEQLLIIIPFSQIVTLKELMLGVPFNGWFSLYSLLRSVFPNSPIVHSSLLYK